MKVLNYVLLWDFTFLHDRYVLAPAAISMSEAPCLVASDYLRGLTLSIPALLEDTHILRNNPATPAMYSIPVPEPTFEPLQLLNTKVVSSAPCRHVDTGVVVSAEGEVILYKDGFCVFRPHTEDP